MHAFIRSVLLTVLMVRLLGPSADAEAAPFAYVATGGCWDCSGGCSACPTDFTVIDTATNTVTATLPFSSQADVAVHPDGTLVYVVTGSYGGNSAVKVIDAKTNTVIATIPQPAWTAGLALNPAGTRLYTMANPQPSSVPAYLQVIDTATNSVIASGPDALIAPAGMAVTPDGSRLYVAQYAGCNGGGNVWVIDTATNAVTTTIAAVGTLQGLAIDPGGACVYTANHGGVCLGTTLEVISTSSNSVQGRVTVGNHPSGVAVSPDGTRIYVTNPSDDTVSIVSGPCPAGFPPPPPPPPVAAPTVAVGDAPGRLAVTADGARVYVANSGNRTVSVIDTTSNTVVGTVNVSWDPGAIAIGPSSTCGNGIEEAAEQCDDGNTTSGDGCSADCKLECGNGVVNPPLEQCDDGNTTSGDCCSSTCQLELIGSPCASDGNACTADACDGAGACTHDPITCSDGDPCTTDDCNTSSGCAYTTTPDTDEDGICDLIDPCTPGGSLPARGFHGPMIRLSKLDKAPGEQKLVFKGKKIGAIDFWPYDPPLDPPANGLHVRIDHARGTMLDVTLPGGAFDDTVGKGWKTSLGRSSATWRYLDKTDTPAQGIRKVIIRQKSADVKPLVIGRGSYAVPSDGLPLVGMIAFQPPSMRCAEAKFPGPQATEAACSFVARGTAIKCK